MYKISKSAFDLIIQNVCVYNFDLKTCVYIYIYI